MPFWEITVLGKINIDGGKQDVPCHLNLPWDGTKNPWEYPPWYPKGKSTHFVGI